MRRTQDVRHKLWARVVERDRATWNGGVVESRHDWEDKACIKGVHFEHRWEGRN